jgi:hypothetical protein
MDVCAGTFSLNGVVHMHASISQGLIASAQSGSVRTPGPIIQEMSAETALARPGRGVPQGAAFLRQLEMRGATPRTQLALEYGQQEAAKAPVAPEEESTNKLPKTAEPAEPSTAMTPVLAKEPSPAMQRMQRIADARLDQQRDRKMPKAWRVCECARFLSDAA